MIITLGQLGETFQMRLLILELILLIKVKKTYLYGMTNFIQKTHLDIGFSAFNCLLDSQCSLLTSQILGSCSKLKWSNRAYAVYWLRGTLLYPWGNMDNILDKRDSKGKVGGGRKEQKVWVPWKEEKRREM